MVCILISLIVTGFFPTQPKTIYRSLKGLSHPPNASNEEFSLPKSVFSACPVFANHHTTLLGWFSGARFTCFGGGLTDSLIIQQTKAYR